MNELSNLEIEIVKLIYQGYTRTEIIAETTLTSKGVADNIRSIKSKLEVTSINGIKSTYSSYVDRQRKIES